MIKLRGTSYVYIALMVVMLVIIGWSLGMKYFASKLLPLTIGSIVFVLVAIGLGREILAGNERKATVTDAEESGMEKPREEWRGYLLHGGWVAAFFMAIYLLGFMISMPLFILSYMRSLGTRWRVAITFAVLTSVLIYVIFKLAIGIDLYRGLVFTWFGY